ncbi:hypothetical protein LSAT2_032297, partial [Lamellibrachia satsuma]
KGLIQTASNLSPASAVCKLCSNLRLSSAVCKLCSNLLPATSHQPTQWFSWPDSQNCQYALTCLQAAGDYEWMGPNSLSVVHFGQVATTGRQRDIAK